MRFRGLPIFWQILLLLVGSLVLVQAVSVALFLSLKPPRPDFNRLSDIAEALGAPVAEHGPRHIQDRMRDKALVIRRTVQAPAAGETMVSDAGFTVRLAAQLRAAPARVRLFYEPDQRGSFPFADAKRTVGQVPMRRGEPIFFDRVVAAIDTGRGWRVVETPTRPVLNNWQKRSLLWFGLSALLMIPVAWFFARRLTRPIRRFAEAADRMGADPQAPPLEEEGPTELRVAAHAQNRMQARLAEHVAERTAMIGAIAHDLRTPLARIAFRIEAAPDPIREKVQADVEQMRAMLAATIGFVRNTARPEAFEPVALNTLLARIVDRERDIGRAVAAGPLAPATMVGDPLALERLFQNLIDNGIAYGERVTVTLVAEAAGATVLISDVGPGLPADAIERMFQPFERGDPSRNRLTGGIGLGLTIARSIARDHGGTLTLRNGTEKGLIAEVRLPARG